MESRAHETGYLPRASSRRTLQWFSLNVPPWNPVTGEGFGGNILGPQSGAMTPLGHNYAGHRSSFSPVAYVDPGIASSRLVPDAALASPAQTITRTLRANVVNRGTVASGPFCVKTESGGPMNTTLTEMIEGLSAFSSQSVEFALVGLPPGRYRASVEVDPEQQVVEAARCNNQVSLAVVAPKDRAALPLAPNHAARNLRLSSSVPQAQTNGRVARPAGIRGVSVTYLQLLSCSVRAG